MASADAAYRLAQQRVGQVLRGKWTLERLLGIGGMAAVYAGTHRNGTRGAIKILHPELAVEPELRARFLREGYAANSIGHPGVVRAIDDDEDEATVFLVMELLEGESIDARALRQGRVLPPSEVLSLADHVLDILVAAHTAGVIHRDIKPENLFLTSTGEVKLLDFGIARIREAPRGPTGTQPGATMGTPVYMAPEQARGRWNEVDGRTDLWAVGATMFTLMSGRFVHEAETENEQLLGAMSHRAPLLATVAPDVPSSVAEVVDRALQYERETRWPDAQTMQSAVRIAYHGLFGKPITTAPKLLVPKDSELGKVSRGGPTTGGAAPAAFARTTLGRYFQEPSKGLLVAFGAMAALLVGGVIVVTRHHTGQAEMPAASSQDTTLTPQSRAVRALPAVEPSAVVDTPPSNVPVLSPSELPRAEPENAVAAASKGEAPVPLAKIKHRPSKPVGAELPHSAMKPPVADEKPHDMLDQQW